MNNSKKQTAMQKLIAYMEENYHLTDESRDQFKKALEEERLKNSHYAEEICAVVAELKKLTIPDIVGRSEQLICDVCGSADVIEAPPMGKNCNKCNPL